MRRQNWVIALMTALLAVTMFSQSMVSAQSQSIRWEVWDATYQINGDGTVDVTERYVIDFTGEFRRGFTVIERDLFTFLDNVSVSSEGIEYIQVQGANEQANTFVVEESAGQYEFQWFFGPVRNVSKEFVISYTLHQAIIINAEVGDRFFWQPVRPPEGVPVLDAEVRVILPPGAEVDMEIGPALFGSGRFEVAGDLNSVVFSGGDIWTSDSFEIGVRFQHGIVPSVEPPWQAAYEAEQVRADRQRMIQAWSSIIFGALGFLTLIGGLFGVGMLWLTKGRDPKTGAVPEYLERPPSGLAPAVAGTLIDERANMHDIVSTLVDLARRGVLTMQEVPQETLGIKMGTDFRFRKVGEATESLADHEDRVVKAVFGGRTERDLSDLRERFYSHIPGIEKALYKEVVKEGYFEESPEKVRQRYTALGVAGASISGAIFFCGLFLGGDLSLEIVDSLGIAVLCPLIAVFLVSVALWISGGVMPAKTRKGAEEAAKWKAFKRYLENIDRLKDLNDVNEQFDEYLPYAIAFGLERGWIRKFSRIETTPMPGWYFPIGYPIYGDFGGGTMRKAGDGGGIPSLNDMSEGLGGGLSSMAGGLTSMLNTAGTVFVSQPSSSGSGSGGGFSGGGFSGGGFSGGGGGGGGFSGFG
ncbi:MAG: DUF2207 domain-containing protein [Chloroflexi bacterium]|nr:DUF2207 domain-containing protein [Chloroflexota bacterium]